MFADKWIPILPNTDAALQLAIAYQWIADDTYDKDYLATHSVGFEKFKDYVLGEEDGVPKTPEWAAEKTQVPSRTIKALARRGPPSGPPWCTVWAALHPRAILSRAGPARSRAAGHAGTGQAGRHSFSIINRAVFGSEDHPAFPPRPAASSTTPA